MVRLDRELVASTLAFAAPLPGPRLAAIAPDGDGRRDGPDGIVGVAKVGLSKSFKVMYCRVGGVRQQFLRVAPRQ